MEWKPSETQKTFMKALEGTDGLTLRQINHKLGTNIASGSINTLITKGYVETSDTTFECNIVSQADGEIVGTCKKTVKKYRLLKEPTEK